MHYIANYAIKCAPLIRFPGIANDIEIDLYFNFNAIEVFLNIIILDFSILCFIKIFSNLYYYFYYLYNSTVS